MKNCRRLFLVVCILSLALCVYAADWPQFRGENFGGVSTEKDLQAEWKETPPMWTFNAETGFSSVAVVDGRVYTQGGERIRGEEQKKLAEQYPELKPNMRELLFCLDAETGEEKWRTPLDLNRYDGRGCLATPMVADGRVFAYSHYGIFVSCDSKTGEEIWRVDTVKTLGNIGARDGLASSPVIHDGQVLLQIPLPEEKYDPEGGWKQPSLAHVVAFDAKTGKVVWKSKGYQSQGQLGHGAGTWSTPSYMELEGVPTLLMYIGNAMIGLNPDDGSERWFFDFIEAFPDMAQAHGQNYYSSIWPLQVGDNRILSNLWNDHPKNNWLSRVFMLEIQDGKPRIAWEQMGSAVQIQNFTIWDDYIYIIDSTMYSGPDIPKEKATRRKRQTEYGQLQCLDSQTGKILWHTNDYSDPELDRGNSWVEDADNAPTWMMVDGKIIIWNRAQVIIGKVSPDGYERLSAFQISERPGKSWTAMAFANGRLYVRSGRTLYGIDLRGKTNEGK